MSDERIDDMERLTVQWGVNPAVPRNFDLLPLVGLDNETWQGFDAIVQRLAAYEDSGLSPEEVEELAQAQREGVLVRLPSILSSSRRDYLNAIIKQQVEYAEAEVALAMEAQE